MGDLFDFSTFLLCWAIQPIFEELERRNLSFFVFEWMKECHHFRFQILCNFEKWLTGPLGEPVRKLSFRWPGSIGFDMAKVCLRMRFWCENGNNVITPSSPKGLLQFWDLSWIIGKELLNWERGKTYQEGTSFYRTIALGWVSNS